MENIFKSLQEYWLLKVSQRMKTRRSKRVRRIGSFVPRMVYSKFISDTGTLIQQKQRYLKYLYSPITALFRLSKSFPGPHHIFVHHYEDAPSDLENKIERIFEVLIFI